VVAETEVKVPALHWVHALAPAKAYVPATHAEQTAEEVALLTADHVPALQLVQLVAAARE
jgi:hypothetical protein